MKVSAFNVGIEAGPFCGIATSRVSSRRTRNPTSSVETQAGPIGGLRQLLQNGDFGNRFVCQWKLRWDPSGDCDNCITCSTWGSVRSKCGD